MGDLKGPRPPVTRKRFLYMGVAFAALAVVLVPSLVISLPKWPGDRLALETAPGDSGGGDDYTQFVNVFGGTDGGGNDFPGVARPWGMVKMGPDNLKPGWESYSGYLSADDAPFSGFSMMHESGTGGAPKYGTVSQLPLVGEIKDPLANLTVGREVADTGSVGYYTARTVESVVVEMAASSRAGIYRYTFPENAKGNILVDVSHVLPSFKKQNLSQAYAGGDISIFPDGHYEGSGIYNNGWNRAPDWTIYFCGYFSHGAVSSKVYSAIGSEVSVLVQGGSINSTSRHVRIGGLFSFDQSIVTSRVGISFISTSQACQNVNSEIPEGKNFEGIIQDTKTAWNTEVLGKITTSSTNEDTLRLLYTSLYFSALFPTNRTGENPGWSSTEPYYDDFFTFWDLFRCSTALWQVIQPSVYEEIIRSLIDIWRHDGYLPDARSSNYNGRTQGGSNADNILADAYVKGVRGAVNWTDGYAAMVKDAEVPPPNTNPPDPQATDSSTKEGRGALPDWLEYGFITPNYTRSASRAVEYAYNDFALSQVASGLGLDSDASKYLNRSRNWRAHWNPAVTSLNFSGFITPRNLTSLIPTTPLNDTGYWASYFYEGGSWEYSWGAAAHDMQTLVSYMGGAATAISRLETMFTPGADPARPHDIIFDDTNEPTFLLPYLYNFLARPDLSVQRSRSVAKKYSASRTGIPGNSDEGAMQTWLLWNMIGLYPLTGQTTFLIASPWLAQMTIDLGNGKTLLVTSTGGDGNGGGGVHVQSLKVNGVVWTKSWLSWGDVFEAGGTMEFVLGEEPMQWATGELPPSPASEKGRGT